MADYKEMYLTLFREVSKAITLLQEAQLETEELYILSEESNIKALPLTLGSTPDDGDTENI